MFKQPVALIALSFLLPSLAAAYNFPTHQRLVTEASAAVCASAPLSGLCAELKQYQPFLRYGAKMEDDAALGGSAVFNGVEFKDEESAQNYGPCKSYVFSGDNTAVCNHYFFVESYKAGGPEGSCGTSILGATKPDCDGPGSFQWESGRQRASRLLKEKVLFYYSKQDKPRAYYWLGRVSHLLADSSVPAHVVPHPINHVEFEHRAYEYEADRFAADELPKGPQEQLPRDLDGLFVELASNSVKVNAAVRAAACASAPETPGCEAKRASPATPLETSVLGNVQVLNDIMNGKADVISKPEVVKERELSRKQLAQILPRAMAFTARLLEIFSGQAGMGPRGIEVQVPGTATKAAPLSSLPAVSFDSAAR